MWCLPMHTKCRHHVDTYITGVRAREAYSKVPTAVMPSAPFTWQFREAGVWLLIWSQTAIDSFTSPSWVGGVGVQHFQKGERMEVCHQDRGTAETLPSLSRPPVSCFSLRVPRGPDTTAGLQKGRKHRAMHVWKPQQR
jgi:hypothetical protein